MLLYKKIVILIYWSGWCRELTRGAWDLMAGGSIPGLSTPLSENKLRVPKQNIVIPKAITDIAVVH